jgi:hypothetical protein
MVSFFIGNNIYLTLTGANIRFLTKHDYKADAISGLWIQIYD